MIAFVLITAGILIFAGSFLLAAYTRHRTVHPPDGSDPWTLFRPRTDDDIDSDRVRMWPALVALVGVTVLVAGLLALGTGKQEPRTIEQASVFTPAPVILSFEATPDPVDTPKPSPGASPVTSASPGAKATQPATKTPGTGSSGSGGGPSAPRITPAPTPTPKPGPALGASTSCFNGVMNLNYSANARSGTKLSTLTVGLDGSTVQSPKVSGRDNYSGSYQRSSGSGRHTFTVTATDTDGGRSVRSYSVNC